MNWSHRPAPPDERRLPLLVPWLASLVPVLVQIQRLLGDVDGAWRDGAWKLASITAVLLLLIRVLPTVWPIFVLIAAGQYGIISGTVFGPHASWIVGSAVLWAVALGSYPVGDRGRWFPSRLAARTLCVPLGLAAVLLVVRSDLRVPGALTGLAAVLWVAAVLAPAAVGARLERGGQALVSFGRGSKRTMDRIGRPMGKALGAIAMLPLAVILTVTWVVHRLLGYNPLVSATVDGSTWRPRRSPDLAEDRLSGRVVFDAPAVGWRRTHRYVAAVAVASVWLAVVFVAAPTDLRTRVVDKVRSLTASDDMGAPAAANPDGGGDGNQAPECPVSCEVFADTPDWQQVFNDTSALTAHSTYDAVTGYRFEDLESDNVNVVNGRRNGWVPPDCTCRRLKVWWFGGSFAFGFWQRDDYSLPSYLAQEAAARGLTLDVDNYAVPGWVAGQGVRAFGQLLATVDESEWPDVVMFVDGANDIGAQQTRNQQGRGADESEPMMLEPELNKLISTGLFQWSDPPEETSDVELLPTDEVVSHAVNRYLRNKELATLLAQSVGARPVFIWQPSAAFSPESASAEPALSARANWLETMGLASKALPDDVIDLTSAFGGVDEPIWGDALHTNERGASLMASTILDLTLPVFEEASSAGPAR